MSSNQYEDYFLRTTFLESIMASSPMQAGLVISSILSCFLPSLKEIYKTKMFIQYTLLTVPFLCTAFDQPLDNNLYISFPAFCIAASYVVLSLLHFNQNYNVILTITNQLPEGTIPDELAHSGLTVNQNGAVTTRTRSLTIFRGSLCVAASVLIISRDMDEFRIKFSTTRTFGTGLMDLGIGCIVLLMGIVGPSRQWTNFRNIFDKKKTVYHSFYTSFSIFTVGCLYQILIKQANIVSDIPDYGRDVNFIHLLAIVKFCGNLIEMVLYNYIPFWLLSLIIGMTYESYLNMAGIKRQMFKTDLLPENVEKLSFYDANIHCLISIAGLLTIYFAGSYIGDKYYKSKSSCPGVNTKITYKMVINTLIFSGICGLTYMINEMFLFVDRASRRLANISYCLWVVTFFLYNICLTLTLEINEEKIFGEANVPKTYSEVIDYSSPMFLVLILFVRIIIHSIPIKFMFDIPAVFCISLFCGAISSYFYRYFVNKMKFNVM